MASNVVKTDFPFTFFSREADIDYLLARMVHFLGAGFHARAGYLGQQACEKYLKALSVQHDGSYLEIHKLLDLAKFCEPYQPFLADQRAKDDLERFDMFDQVGRYGGAANFDPLSKGISVAGIKLEIGPAVQVAGALVWTPVHLQALDRIVCNMRGRLNFANAHDGLKAVLTEDSKSSFNGLWTGPVPLKDILTKDNLYFRTEPLPNA